VQIQFGADPATGFADIDKLDLRRFQGQRLPVNRHNFERCGDRRIQRVTKRLSSSSVYHK
jgi:hypothetical protein